MCSNNYCIVVIILCYEIFFAIYTIMIKMLYLLVLFTRDMLYLIFCGDILSLDISLITTSLLCRSNLKLFW